MPVRLQDAPGSPWPYEGSLQAEYAGWEAGQKEPFWKVNVGPPVMVGW